MKNLPTNKRIELTSGNVISYFDGGGNLIEQTYKSDGKVFKLPNISPQKQREEIYSKQSMSHPAKMETPLAQYLIQKYTKPGDVILDPMAGISTTNIEASRMGRHSIGVEYEPRFVTLSEKNIRLLEKSGQKIGDIKIYKGDARELSKLLKGKKVDVITTSPPYSSLNPQKGHDVKMIQVSRKSEGRKTTNRDILRARKYEKIAKSLGRAYGKNKNNIANLPHGDIDAVIFSPPFSSTQKGGGIAKKGHFLDPKLARRSYQPHLQGSKSNIGNLKHGNINVIITSPPYGEGLGHGHGSKKWAKIWKKSKSVNNLGSYSKGNKNLGNMGHKTYLSEMRKVYEESYRVLKPKGKMILVVKRFRKNGKIVKLDEDTIKLAKSVGFKYKDTKLKKIQTFSFWQRNYMKKYPNAPKIPYEHILIFEKP